MSRTLMGLVLGIFSCVSVAATSEPAQGYKCHITAAKGDKVVFYRWKVKDVNLNIASLPGKQLTASDGKKYFIKEVIECVSLSQEFTSDNSKQLDKVTLR
ncbi:TapY2 family type IVa secretion system protein [Shewanella baltica]|uniref:TapY2 family type IVa secretion system protein n=1 Tax=Shewanella baltica TaxID=62322 RepID=UPI003D79D176